MGIKEIDADETVSITRLPPYIPPRKSMAKVNKDPNLAKFQISTLLLPENIPFEGNLLAQIPYLNMEDWDLGDHTEFPQLELSKYLKNVYYEKSDITRLELMKWVVRVECKRLLNMLWLPHYSHKTINIVCVHQLLMLVHDGCFWLGVPILITNKLIHRITLFPYQRVDPVDVFVRKL